jgi:uncharacterized protein YukE
MQDPLQHLAKRVTTARSTVDEVLRELEKQTEREGKSLEEAAFGEDFDADFASRQEDVVAALNEALRLVDSASASLEEAARGLRETR